jgi:diguanylate cyclase (GGDEF)-like protein/PAS domain S-box-containing protein
MRVRMRPHKAFKVLSSTLLAGSSHDTVGIIALAAVAFAAVTGWRFADPNPGSGVFFLLTVPISLLAFRFGVRGGLAGASIGIGLTVVWAQSQGAAIGESGYPVRAAVFVIVGVVVGWQSQRRHRVEREADRWFSMTGELACVASFQGYFTRVNPAWTKLLGYDQQELLGRPFVHFVHPDDVAATNAEAAALAGGSYATVHFQNRYLAKDGSWHWLEWSSRSDTSAIYASARDVTRQKQLEQQLLAMATNDPLTGVANRRGWSERLAVELARAERSDEPLCLAMIDLDKLKTTNDTGGHQAGDRLLFESAKAWSVTIREVDVLARLGGDEFGVLLPDCTETEAAEVVQRMRVAMPSGHSFSAGIAKWNLAESPHEFSNRADQALYDAKAQGRAHTSINTPHAVAT